MSDPHGHRWSPEDYARHAAFVPALGAPVLALLGPKPGERILDLGCGDGVLTQKLVEAGADVVGIDADPAMVAAATAKGLDARLGDGCALGFDTAFDAVFTNAALHWMPDPPAVAAGVFRALKPGGRYVGECGGFGNIAALRAGIRAVLMLKNYAIPARDPQFYATAEEFTEILCAAGFVDIDARLIARPTPLPTGITGWLQTFRAGFLDTAGMPRTEQPAVAEEIQAFLEPILRDSRGNWIADYVRLRFTARKPE